MNFGNKLEHFSLRWNNFDDNMRSGFHDLLRTEDFVDVTIAVEGKLIQAHKMVLSVCSPYFKNIFKTNPCQHPVIFLKDVSHKELSDILQFVYLGEVSIQQEELPRFLKTAEALQIKGLTGDDYEKKTKFFEDSLKENQKHLVTGKQTVFDTDLPEKEMCPKKLKLSSVNYQLNSNCKSLIKSEFMYPVIEQSQRENKIKLPKAEPNQLGLSDVESGGVSVKDDSNNVSDSFMQDMHDTVREDINQSSPAQNTSDLSPGVLKGIQGLTSDSFVMADGNQGLSYFPLLTKNQGLCPICGRILQHKKNLQTHIADQHSGVFRSWPCQICQKVCKTWSALRVHTSRHHTKVGFTQMVDVGHPMN